MKRYMNARVADPVCLAVNPEKSSAKCVMPLGHLGKHRSLTTVWEVKDEQSQAA